MSAPSLSACRQTGDSPRSSAVCVAERQSLPDFFTDQEQYDDWLDEVTENEIEEFLDAYEDSDLHVDAVHEWARHAPTLDHDHMQWMHLFHDVNQYAWVDIPRETIVVPEQNPFTVIGHLVENTVRTDLGCRMQERLEQDGYEVTA